MAILIKNPETERKARELASLRGVSLTGAIDGALDKALARGRAANGAGRHSKRWSRQPNGFRQEVGLDKGPVQAGHEG